MASDLCHALCSVTSYLCTFFLHLLWPVKRDELLAHCFLKLSNYFEWILHGLCEDTKWGWRDLLWKQLFFFLFFFWCFHLFCTGDYCAIYSLWWKYELCLLDFSYFSLYSLKSEKCKWHSCAILGYFVFILMMSPFSRQQKLRCCIMPVSFMHFFHVPQSISRMEVL